MVVNTLQCVMKKRRKTILEVKIARRLTKRKQDSTILMPKMMHLPVWPHSLQNSIQNVQHFSKSSDQMSHSMMLFGMKTDPSRVYTNHSVRASGITLLSGPKVPDRHIMFVSGYSNQQSIDRLHHKWKMSLTYFYEPSEISHPEMSNDHTQ